MFFIVAMTYLGGGSDAIRRHSRASPWSASGLS
jgi:hypothetical protein